MKKKRHEQEWRTSGWNEPRILNWSVERFITHSASGLFRSRVSAWKMDFKVVADVFLPGKKCLKKKLGKFGWWSLVLQIEVRHPIISSKIFKVWLNWSRVLPFFATIHCTFSLKVRKNVPKPQQDFGQSNSPEVCSGTTQKNSSHLTSVRLFQQVVFTL